MQTREYYTAKEAQEILGMTYSALRHQVNIGNLTSVTPPGRKQAVYPKEEVDKLKHELQAWYISRNQPKMPPAKFVKATIGDMPTAVALAHEVFGGLNTIPIEKRVAWLKKNPDIDYLLKEKDQIVGYFSLVPLQPETIEDLLTLRRFAKDLTTDDILPYIPGTPVDLYGMAIGIIPGVSAEQKSKWGKQLMLGARSVLLDLGKRGIIIHSINAHSFTPDGIKMMRHLGFTETVPKAPGLHDFIIDVERSGVPFIMDYKRELKQWQEKNKGAKTREAAVRSNR